MFLAIFGLIFGSGDSILVSLADDDDNKKRYRNYNDDDREKDRANDDDDDDDRETHRDDDDDDDDEDLIPLGTVCKGKTLQQWIDDGFNVIRGTDKKDELRGTNGPDVIAGGKDNVKTGKGNDMIFARDGNKDKIDGGKGNDFCQVDEKEKKIKNCEVIEPPYMGFAP
jgi:hypothetical protein